MKWIFAAFLILFSSLTFGDSKGTLIVAAPKVETVHLSQHNTVVWEDEIDIAKTDTVLTAITAKYKALGPKELLYVFIFSPGGSVDIAKAASNYLNQLPKIRLVCMDCESAAGWIFENSNTPRLIVPRSLIMMHEIRIFALTPTVLKEVDMKDFLSQADEFNAIFAKRLGMPLDVYAARISGINWEVRAAQMLAWGLADASIDVECDAFISLLMPNTCARVSE